MRKDCLEPAGVQIGVKIRAGGVDAAVRRPGRDVIRMIGEVVARVDVQILGSHHVVVVGAVSQVVADRARQVCPAGHGQRTALAKVFLNVDDDQRAHDTTLSPTGTVPESPQPSRWVGSAKLTPLAARCIR